MTSSAPARDRDQRFSVAQWRVWTDPARFRVVVAGRRFGKTYLVVHELYRAARTGYGKRVWFVAPTYRQAEQIAWRDLKRMIPAAAIAKKNESDLSIILRGYESEIALRGAENYDNLRGVGVDFAALDEYADMDPAAWEEVLRPALSDRRGEALFTGTPRGFNHFYDLFQRAHTEPDWTAFQFSTLDGGNVPAHEIEAARRELDPRVFRQEYEASFEALAGRVYYAFERAQNMRSDLRDTGGTVLVGMDFNVDPMSAVVGFRVADQLHVVDEIVIQNSNTAEMAAEIRRRYPNRDVAVYPDPSGNSRKTSAPVGQTDFALLRQAGFRVIADKHAPPVVDRINEVNALCCNSEGVRRLFVHPLCVNLVKGFEGLTYKPGTSLPDKESGLDHVLDSLGYLVHSEFPIRKRDFGVSPFAM